MPDWNNNNRIRKVVVTGLTTILSRGIAVTANFIAIPLVAGYLGTERFGVWLLLSTLMSWISIADIGLANSLTNGIAAADAQDDLNQAKILVSNAFYILLCVTISLTIICMIFYPLVNWSQVFNTSSEVIALEAGTAAIICCFFFSFRLPLSVAGRVYLGYQEGYYYQFWIGLSNILSVTMLALGTLFKLSLAKLVLVVFGSSLLVELICSIHLFYWRRPKIKPSLHYFNWITSLSLLKTGIKFWVIQISAIVSFQTDLIVVTQLFGIKEAAIYGIILKMFSLINMIQSTFFNPLWVAYCEAINKKDLQWIMATFKKSLKIAIIWSVIGSIIISISAQKLLNLWLPENVKIDLSLLFAMVSTCILFSIAQCIASLLNGLSFLNSQIIFGFASGITNILLSCFLGLLTGVSGVAWATAFSILIFSIFCVGFSAYKKINKVLIQV
jgi:O-antigen/teichoic acid export membrane protein